ncbi:MAG TPA: uroporphyrinogen-III C-methyltransferase [Anaerolineae bacterium]
MTGIVYIVGAGPGDPGLITVKGLDCLRRADVVLFDRLADRRLLDEARGDAELIDVGKEPARHRRPQSEINALLIVKAREDKTVVRLKGGDPFVFGRGGEECEALAEAGIPFEVVPGVSSAIAVPAYAGIPVTHREMARSFTVITGHTCEAQKSESGQGPDWTSLPRTGTLVFLMGVGHLPEIARRLAAHGCSPDTPVAVIHRGTTPAQRVVEGTLADIAERAGGIQAPATLVVGDVVHLRGKLDWFHAGRETVSTDPDESFLTLETR